MPTEVTVAMIAGVSSLVCSLVGMALGYWLNKRKTEAEIASSKSQAEKIEAETNEIIRQTVMGLITPLQNKINSLQGEVDSLRREVEQYKTEMDKKQRALDKQDRRYASLKRFAEKLRDAVRSLSQQLREAGCSPCVDEPPDWVDDDEA